MLPYNGYQSYQRLPNPGQYTFDLKVNVDFNSGKVNLNVPPVNHPFVKKQEIPVVYNPVTPYLTPNQSYYSMSNQPLQSSYQQIPLYQSGQSNVRNEQVYSSGHLGSPQNYSDIMRYQGHQKPKSTNETYPDTFSSFSINMEKSLEAVNCVICDKPITRQQFHSHLEEHKGRKKQYINNYARVPNQPSKNPSFSVRNQNSLAEVADMYRQAPSRNSLSLQPKDMSHYGSRKQNNCSNSREINETHSRIVFAPRDPSRIVSGGNPQSELHYSGSSGQPSKVIQAGPAQFYGRNLTMPQQSVSMQNLSQGYMTSGAITNLSQNNRTNSVNMLPTELTKRPEELKSSRSSQNSRQNNFLQFKKPQISREKFSNGVQNKGYNADYFDLHKTESHIIQSFGKQPTSLSDFNQSRIDHLTNISRMSKESSIKELQRQLKIQQIEEQSSSDDEKDMYLSVRPSATVRACTSVDRSRYNRMDASSNFSNGLTRSKIPVNYLAVQQFIQNPLYYSCYRSTHRM